MSWLKSFFSIVMNIVIALTLNNTALAISQDVRYFIVDKVRSISEEKDFEIKAFNADEHFFKGNDYIDSEKNEEAVIEYTKAIEIVDYYPNYYRNRGIAYLKLNKYDEAKKDINKLFELDKENPNAYLLRAAFYYNQRIYEPAKENFMMAGKNFLKIKEYDDAIMAFEHVLKIDRYYSAAYYMLGTIDYDKENYLEAVNNFNQAIFLAKDSDKDQAYNMRGCSYNKLKKFDTAIDDFSQAIQIDASHAEYYENRALAYYDFEKYQNALTDFNELVRFDESYSEVYKEKISKCKILMYVEKIETYVGEIWSFVLLVMVIFGWYVVFCPSGTRRQGFGIFIALIFIIALLTVLVNKMVPSLRDILVAYFWICMLDSIVKDLRQAGTNVPDWIDNPLQSIKNKLSQSFGGSRNS